MSGSGSSIHCEVIQALEAAGTVNIFVICLDKPVSQHNIIDRELALGLARAVCLARKKAAQGEIDVVVVCSAKEKSFLAGADILYELKMLGLEGSWRAFVESGSFQTVLCGLEALPVPTVAILNGVTLGGGLEVALACDYRIADLENCQQIGLPEVKLGVLPGVGGCCRLPRLIGFRSSLSLLLTGQAITAQKALKLGVIDHLVDNTETVVQEDSQGHRSYQYEWLSHVLACIEKKRVGRKSLEVFVRAELSAVDSCRWEEEKSLLSEDELMREMSESWEECEKKATRKYPREAGRWNLFWSFVKNMLFYIMALFQLWRTVGLRMPAPYTCLQTTFRCLYTNSWLEAMSMNSLGFVNLVTTAESKSLMSLFLITRKLKKFALTFGLGSDEKTPEKIDKERTALCVLVSKKGLRFSSAFIQGLLYAEWEVNVYEVSQGIRKELQSLVLKHFNYALKRGHLKEEEVQERMEKLRFTSTAEGNNGKQLCLVVNAAFSEDTTEAISTLLSKFPKCIQVDITPFSDSPRPEGVLQVNMGDPLRKNTLCVEMSSSSPKVPSEDVRTVAAFIDSLGKIPVVTPTSPIQSITHYITIHHWVLAVKMLVCGGMSAQQVDSCLLAAGFTKGPFATMKELDKAYVSQMVERGTKSGIDCTTLTSYLCNKLTVRYKRGRAPPTSKVAKLFLYNAASAALLVKKFCLEVPEEAIDALCVSSLVHYPPTEGGPLSFLARVGNNPLEDLAACESTALQKEAELLLSGITSSDETRKLFVKHEDGEKDSEFRKRRSEFAVLSAAELRLVGPTRGVENTEVFLYPLTFVAMFVVFLFFILVILGYKLLVYPIVLLSAYLVHSGHDAIMGLFT